MIAELCSRAGFPAGLVNCVHGDEAAMRALCRRPPIVALAFAGGADISRRVAALANDGGLPCVAGSPDRELQRQWRTLLGYGAA
jgi:malonate-semialdehyde dehydrogenase (acetylating)/methylmalonate-semialdehyde dehydrogenase